MMEFEWIEGFEDGNMRSRSLMTFLYTPVQLVMKQATSSESVFFETWLFVKKDGIDMGHLAFYRNPAFANRERPVLLLGNFECHPDEQLALTLLEKAVLYAKKNGYAEILGPMNGSTWATHRFITDGIQPIFFTEVPQPEWYPLIWKQAGFNVSDRYVSNIQELRKETLILTRPETKQRLTDQNLVIRPLDKNRFEEEMEGIYEFSLNVFQQNHHYSPISKQSFISRYLPVQDKLDPRFVLQAFNGQQELVALFFCIHDFYDPTGEGLVVKTIARHPDPAYSGITHMLYEQIQLTALEAGYTRLIHAFAHETNQSKVISEGYQAGHLRTYTLYRKMV
jgi:L-amino acid N-acyltransferase YncA